MTRRLAALATVTLLFLACADEPTVLSPGPHVGTYVLQTVGGGPLPRTVYMFGVTIVGGEIELLADRTYRGSIDWMRRGANPHTEVLSGQYTIRGDALEFGEGAHRWAGSFSGDLLTVTRYDIVYGYGR